MTTSSEILAGRATSAFPVSVGTSLALESVFEGGGASIDPEREIPQKIDIATYQEFWVNISTLFRNLFGAVPSAEASQLLSGDCADQLLQEMNVIESLTREQSHGSTKINFYFCSFKSVDHKYKHAQLRLYNTDKKKFYKNLLDYTCEYVIRRQHESEHPVKIYDCDLIPLGHTRALILTHNAHDLLGEKKFAALHLLESHTGLLRKPNSWHAKYYQGKSLTLLPFNRVLLQIFGDNEMFHPLHRSLRDDIIELAEKRRWSFATTDAKVREDLKELKNPYAVEMIKQLLAH